MRVRWAFEEVGQPYDVRLASFPDMKAPAHRERNPCGQISTYEHDGLVLFESGAIVLHIAEQHTGLLPRTRTHGPAPSPDVRRAQHGGTPDRRTQHGCAVRAGQAVACGAPCDAG